MRTIFFVLIFSSSTFSFSQDTIYARKVIKELTSKKYSGRGYLKNGVEKAAIYLQSELKKYNAIPLFTNDYFQTYSFNVNTYPDDLLLKLNGKELKPGKDFIIAPESNSLDGIFPLTKIDSVTWRNESHDYPLFIERKKKLTFSVSTHTAPYCKFEVLETSIPKGNLVAEVEVENKFSIDYKCKNVCGYLKGTQNNDTMIVFTAHFDHLGGMGKKVFFPGANDNASGVSFVLNLLKYYVKNPPKYKTLFLFFSGEEAGLLGSQFFTESKAVDLSKIKFLINLDLLGTGEDGIMLVNGAIHEKEFTAIQKINAEKNLVKEIKKRGKARNSDHYWFSEAGVPGFFLYTLGGVSFYHDIYDQAKTLSLADYNDVFKLVTTFINQL
ncbi:MAG: Zn-dependent exopeptidase M28 [Sphingobacteriaceae bacterium]|nr:Zn-dependent exopeptidase M28 [Sphingobacteriaceae bacterium]